MSEIYVYRGTKAEQGDEILSPFLPECFTNFSVGTFVYQLLCLSEQRAYCSNNGWKRDYSRASLDSESAATARCRTMSTPEIELFQGVQKHF
jgi:hypothetical protein